MRSHLALASLVLVLGGPAAAYEVETLQSSGGSANRIDLVVLGDGYRLEDQAQLTSDVQSFLSRFWQQTPYAEYRAFFNVKLIHVISNQNGADNGSYGAQRDTALGAYYNCYNIDRLICLDSGAVYQAANADAPEWDFLFVIVNDPKYGGSGGSISVFSIAQAAGDIAIHEFGHSFGGLADEYEDAYPGYPPCGADCPEPNVTTQTVRALIKWNPWIDPLTPVPTPETGTYWDVVGLFEGARYFASGVYRPRQTCMMRQLGVPFCEVCQEALTLSVYREVSPLDGASPAGAVELGSCDSAPFSVSYPQPAPDSVEITWRVDGQVAQTGGADFTLDAAALAPGAHQVEAELEDLTPLVRTDPSQLLVERKLWAVQVVGSPVCRIGGACVPDGSPNPANACEVCDAGAAPGAWTPLTGVSCEDGLFCNGAERCQSGACEPGQPPCDEDGLACTLTCDEAGQRCNALQAGSCLVGGACLADGDPNPANPCEACDAEHATSAWTPLSGVECGDGLFCNGQERCQAGVCQAGAPPCSEDGLVCTETCDEAGARCNAPLAGTCAIAGACLTDGGLNPANPCEGCDADLAPTAWTPRDGVGCEDGVFCNGAERCQAGVCAPGALPCSDDGLACTVTCDEAGQRCNRPLEGFCAIGGACLAAGEPEPGNPCRTCQPQVDPGVWTPIVAGICDDGDPCTTGDACLSGACVPSGRLCNELCPCEESGCGCAATSGGGPAVLWLALGLLALGRTRRRP